MNTTNLPISSNEYVKQYLIKFLMGDISIAELSNVLEGTINIDFNDAPFHRSIDDLSNSVDFRIAVSKKHLCKLLIKYQRGLISELELSNWAALIYMLPYFIPEGGTDEDRWNEGESILWEVIQQLVLLSSNTKMNNQTIDDYVILLSCE